MFTTHHFTAHGALILLVLSMGLVTEAEFTNWKDAFDYVEARNIKVEETA